MPFKRSYFWGFFILLNLGFLAFLFFLQKEGRSQFAMLQKPLPVYGELTPFKLTSQEGIIFSSEQMRGRPWLINFMFTRCPNECPRLNFKMSLLRGKLPDSVAFASFSVDPENDTPAALDTYAKKFKKGEGSWFFLTGPKKTIQKILEDCHYSNAEDPMTHSLRLALLDTRLRVRGYYDSQENLLEKKILNDIQLLQRKG